MSSILKRLGKLLPFGKTKPVGYDLDGKSPLLLDFMVVHHPEPATFTFSTFSWEIGNRFFEWPNPAGGRPRRSVEYKIKRDIPDYLVQERLPVQWMSWLSHTRLDPPTPQELQADLNRRSRLAHNVAQIEARDAAESERRRLLSGPTESTDVGPTGRAVRDAPGGFRGQGVDRPGDWERGDPKETYPGGRETVDGHQRSGSTNTDPYAYTPPRPTSSSQSQLRSSYPTTTSSNSNSHSDPNAPTDQSLRAQSQRETELARRRMEVSKSPLSGFVPIDPGRSERAGRVGMDGVKGDERRGDGDASNDPGSVVPRPRRRGAGAGAVTEENKGAKSSPGQGQGPDGKGKMDVDKDELAKRGRVDATAKSEVQDVQRGSEREIREKAEELERR